MSGVMLHFFGTPIISVDGEVIHFENRKSIALLAYLVVTQQYHSREKLAVLLWPEADSALASLRTALWDLRKHLGDHCIESTRQDVTVIPDTYWADVQEYSAAANLTTKSLVQPQYQIETLQRVVDLYRDSFMAGFGIRDSDEYDDWLREQVNHYERMHERVLIKLCGLYQAAGDTDAAVRTAERLWALDRLSSKPVELLIQLHMQAGNRSEALRIFDSYATLTTREFGEASDETLAALRAKLLRSSTASTEPKRAQPVTGVLVPGQVSADVYHTPESLPGQPRQLIGRDSVVQHVLSLIMSGEHVVLAGLGGIGKTSIAAVVSAEFIRQKSASVVWLEVGFQQASEVFAALGRAFDEQNFIARSKHPAGLIRDLLSRKCGLIVLDNCWSAPALYEIVQAIPDTLPLIVTSRQRIPIDGEIIDVEKLTPDDAMKLLSAQARRPFSDDADVSMLLKMIGYHPYAIEIAGRQLKAQPSRTARDLAIRYAQGVHNIALPGGYGDQTRLNIEVVIGSSAEAVSEDARTVLWHMGMLSASHATLNLLDLMLNGQAVSLEDAIAELEQSSLVRIRSDANAFPYYDLHDLTYSYCRDQFHAKKMGYAVLVRGATLYVQQHGGNIHAMEQEYTNIMGAIRAARQLGDIDSVITMVYAIMVGGFFDARGYTPELLEHVDESIRLALEAGQSYLEILHFLYVKRSNVCQMQQDLEGAFELTQKALVTSPTIEQRALMKNILGTLAHRLGLPDYQSYLDEAEAIARQHNIVDVLSRNMEYRGHIAVAHQNPEEALRHLEQAAHFAATPDRRFFTLYNLLVVQIQFDNQRVAENREKALRILDAVCQLAEEQDNDLWRAMCRSCAGQITHAIGNRAETERLMKEALEIYERAGNKALADWVRTFLAEQGY